MQVRTLLRFLIGDARAIKEIATNRHALWIGLLFVISAGFAREYDGEALRHEPWHLFIPLAASLLTSFVLFAWSHGLCGRKPAGGVGWLGAYRAFLTLFWMTAPLAWLYAIPYERFLSPGDAVRANLMTLAVVSLWRVLLMARVLVVTMGFSPLTAFGTVMTFATALAVALSLALPIPIIVLMGGVRMSESHAILSSVRSTVCMLSLPVGLACLVLSQSGDRRTRGWRVQLPHGRVASGASGWLLAVLALLVWIPVLPGTQREQELRWRVEQHIGREEFAEALALLNEHPQHEFPPHWDPPPRVFSPIHFKSGPQVLGMWDELARQPTSSWIRAYYLEKLGDYLQMNRRDEENQRLVQLLRTIPEGPELLQRLKEQNPWKYENLQEELKQLEERAEAMWDW